MSATTTLDGDELARGLRQVLPAAGHPFLYNRSVPVQPSLVCAAPQLAPLILARVRHIAL